MLRAVCISGDKGQVDLCGHGAGQLALCLLCSLLQSLERHLILTQVDAAVLLCEGIRNPVDDALIEVVAAETVVTRGGKDFKYTVRDLEQRYIKCTAAEVEYHYLLVNLFIHTVCKCRCGRLVYDTQDLKTRYLTCVLSRLTLCIGEVCGDGDDRLAYLCSEICLCVRLHLLKDHSGDLLRSVALVVDGYLIVGTHLTLDGDNCAVGVGDSLTLSYLTDKTLTVLCECDDRRGRSRTLGICYNDRLAALVNGNAAVGSTKVNAYDFFHNIYPPFDYLHY